MQRQGGAFRRALWHAAGCHALRATPVYGAQCLCVGTSLVARRHVAQAGHGADAGTAVAFGGHDSNRPDDENHHQHLPSTDVRDDPFDAEDFDELEAASQEVHDLCFAMIAYLRRADPDGTTALFQGRTKRGFREPKPERQRRMLHGHHDRTSESKNLFGSDKDFNEATQLFLQWGEKLLLLLNKPVLDRLVESAGKSYRDNRSDGIQRFKRPIERATWRTFPHRWYKHAPFEVQQLRADIPESAVLNTRFYRDHCTLRYLFSLMEPQHAYRAALENRLFEITREYDPHTRSSRK